MTCIVGAVDFKTSSMVVAGDSFGGNEISKGIYASTKVFSIPIPYRTPAIFGFTTSWRFGQLLEYGLKQYDFSAARKLDSQEFVVTNLVEASREVLHEGGFLRQDNGREAGGNILLAYDLGLYYLESDFSAIKCVTRYASVGAGASVALGAIAALLECKPTYNITDAVHHSIKIAERLNPYVALPINSITVYKHGKKYDEEHRTEP